jgi:alkylation response protein AidB-like acyl-CoA dehydrogenase
MPRVTSETAEQTEFRVRCRAWLYGPEGRPWLAAHREPGFRLPQGPLEIASEQQLDWLRRWQHAAHAAGLIGCDYPREFGGGGLRKCQWIANHEMQTAGAPFLPNIIGLGMAAPTILHHGTDAQKRRLLPPLLASDEIWCQGFSEPGAGSDLAGVQSFAVQDGDRWLLNGHKVWTTLAHFADWMILLCRTDRGDKYRGLSYFVVPLRDNPGVTVRPLIKMTGELGFNEVLFEDVAVPDDLRLDEVGRGWEVAMTTLSHERGAGGLVTPRSGGSIGDESKSSLGAAGLIPLARQTMRSGKPASDDPLLRDKIVQMQIRQRAFEQSERRASVPALVDNPLRVPLQHKLNHSELLQDTAAFACEITGLAATLHHTDASAPVNGQWPLAYMNSYGFTIAAGSNEIQRNILGERVLGLAKSK